MFKGFSKLSIGMRYALTSSALVLCRSVRCWC